MNTLRFFSTILLLVLLITSSCDQTVNDASESTSDASSTSLDSYAIEGANILEFGPGNILFVGDSKNGIVHAIEINSTELKDPVPYNMKRIDQQLAEKLEIPASELIINDMKVNPYSQEAYIAVKRGHLPGAPSFIAVVNPMGQLELLDIANTTKSYVEINNKVNPDYTFWKDIPASSLNITDIDYHQNHIYVAGLTNGEFASNLRKIAYPFTEEQANVGSIEMYHTVHTQMETRAPIRTMLFEELDGESTLIASYTCTPLVTIPASEIVEGSDIKAKTIAELGYGNAPVDMVSFMVQEQDGSYDKKLLITHKQRGGSVISLKELAAANKQEGMQGFTFGPEGKVNIFQISTANVIHIDDQNQMMLLTLRRNIDDGSLELISKLKGSYFRLSDFISEYNFPDYEYPAEQEGTKQFHDMVKPLEGYPELTSDKKGD
ncbi:MAG: hypothetical protein AAFO07_20530 [Bacteroidota bacterium]